MKNKRIQYFASAAALILGAVLLTTCTIGLGDAVDTKSPKVSITYPPVQSIIKNTFTLRGTASDDNELVGVLITVTNTETDEVFDSYQATVDRATNTWSFAANRRNEDGSFEFEDGKYQIVATAVDGANRKTVASTTYEIDNTAPVLVLNRPGTVGPVGGVKPEVYGSELKLTGSANDDHALDLVSMRVFRADGTQIGEPLTYPNVSGVGMDILLAKHYTSPADADQQALTDRYAAIYDHSTGGTQNFYCLVDISDYAREYDPPANVASADNTRGNVSQAFWLYDGIYSRVFDKSGFGLAMSDLTSVLSGRYASVATAEEVKTYLAENQQDSTVWSDTAVTFSLNPENSPYYEVVGYNALATNEAITAQASNGTNLTVRVSAGRDQRPLLSDTIRVYLVPCNANGAELAGDGGNRLLLPSVAELGGDAAAIAVRNEQLSKTGNDYVVSVDVGTLQTGNYYIVKVEGEDQAGYEITDLKGTFGFQIIPSGNPPVLVVNSPSDLLYISAPSVNFDGTVTAEGGLSSITATVTITCMSGGTAVRTAEPQTFTTVPSDTNHNWAFTLDTATDIDSDVGLYLARVTIVAANQQNNRTEQTLRLYIDHQDPKATITKVTPDYDDSNPDIYTVNGIVDVTLSLTDNDQIDSYSYTIGGGTPVSATGVSSPVVLLSIPSINTRLYPDDQDLPFTVTLRDRARNETTVDLSNVIHIDQDTDRPTIELSNPETLAADPTGAHINLMASGSSITGTVADDDGVFSLQLTIYDTDGIVAAQKLFDSGKMSGSVKQKIFSYTPPDTPPDRFGDGIYRLTLVAYDINTSPIASNTTEGWFSYDANPPRIDSWVTDPVGVDVINAPFKLSVTCSDDYALKETDSIIVYQSFNGGTAEPLDHADLTPNGTNTSCDWVAENLPRNLTSPGDPAPVGEYTYKVTVYDWLNNSTTKETVTVQYDTANPVVTAVTFPAETGVNNYVTGSTDFRGTASDEGTGVVTVECSLDGSTWVEATGDKNWSINPSLLNLAAEGDKTLYVRATDAVGNESSPIFTRPFVYDNSTPSLTAYNTDPADLTLTNAGFSLSGSAEDGYKLRESDSVVVTQQLGSGSKIPVPVSITSTGDTSCDWDILDLPRIPVAAQIGAQVPFGGTRDGIYKYEITVYDAAGQRSDTETITVQLDSSAPSAVINVPAVDSVVGVNAPFQGTASDPAPSSGITTIRYSLDGTNWTSIVPSATWNTTHLFDSTDTEGTKTLRVVAEDVAGNIGTEATRNFVFDRADPTITINGDSAWSTRTTFSLTGNAKDSWGVKKIVVTQKGVDLSGIDLPDIDLPDIDASGSTDYTWNLAGLPRNPASTGVTLVVDGVFTYEVQAIDLANKTSTLATVTVTIDRTPPDKNDITAPTADPGALGVNALSGSTYLFRGEAGEPSTGVGVAKIWYQITKSSTASVIPEGESPADHGYTKLATGGNWSFTKNFPAEIAEGTGYWLHVLAEDKAGNRNAEATSVEFDVDLSNPVVTEVINTDTMQNRREKFELRGTATDSHGIASVTITQSLDGGTAIPISTNGPELTGSNWSLIDLPRDVDTIGNPSEVNDTYEYKITTTDRVGKTHTITRRVRFDSVGPEIEFTSPSYTPAEDSDPEEISWMNSGTLAVTGRATDLTDVAGVYYSTEATAPPLPFQTDPEVPLADTDWFAKGWEKAVGSLTNWSVPFDGLGQGVHAVWISAMDSNSNTTSAKQIKFGVDTALPTVTGTAPLANTNALFTIGGDISDTNKLDPDAPITITQSFNEGEPVTISGVSLGELNPANGQSYPWTLANVPQDPENLGNPIALDGTADGVYDFLITAKDIAGKTREATISVRIDTVAPVMVAPDTIVDASGWTSTAFLSLTGSVTETGSGIDTIEYAYTNSAGEISTQFLSLSGVNWSGNIPLEDGVKEANQSLVIRAVDKAGNKAVDEEGNVVEDKVYLFNVDTVPPAIKKISPTGQQLTNLKSDLVAICSVTDELSGIDTTELASVRIKSIGGTNVASNSVYNDSDDTWTITVSEAILKTLTLVETASVIIEANDTAGNTITDNYTLSVDQTPPTVTISSPGTGSTINKKTEIRGTASDNKTLARVDLTIEDPDGGADTIRVPFTSAPTNWSYEFNTEAWESAGGRGQVDVQVVATDEAGNTATLDYTYTVDQESDRPRIRSNNVTFDDNGPDKYPSTLKMTPNVIGTIEDDDGPVTSVEIWDPEAGEWVVQTMSGISYTYESYGDDGTKILRFRIVDAAGETFETGGSLPPRFEWGTGGSGEYAYTERTYRVDTNIPKNMGTVYANRTGGNVFADTVTLDSNSSFGGTSRKFRLWLGASDDNGIDSIKVTIPSADPEGPYAEQTLRSDTHVVEITDVPEVAGYTIFRSDEFDISEVPDGNRKISITVTDNSGLESLASYTILVDNTEPDIDYTYPEHEVDQVFGNLTITGLAADDGSGLAAIEYKIGYDYESQSTWNPAITSGAAWSITDFATDTRIENYTRQEVTNVDVGSDTLTVPGHGYIDGTVVWIGADELPGGLDYGTPYYILYLSDDTFKLASTLGGPAIDITTTVDASVGVSAHAQSAVGNIWYLPVMVRATDTAGNEYITPEWIYRIKVDPSGDKPTAFVTYPEEDTVSAEPNPIVGGTIRMSGYAEDNIDVSAVFMQIDKNGDGIFNSSDGDWYISEEGETPDINQFEGRRVNGGRNWTMNINATGEFNPEEISGEEIEVDVVYRIVDTGTAAVNWTTLGASAAPSVGETFTAVRDGSADDSTARVKPVQRLIMYRVRACDNNGLYGSWTLPHYFLIDEGVPIIGSLRFEKPGRQRFYEPDMWLSGDWTLTGYVADESDIQAISIGNTTGADASQVTGSLAGNSDWFNIGTFGGLNGYGMEIPITTTGYLSTRTSNSFTFSATDKSTPPMTASREIRINYDNTKPNISAPYGGATPIKNSNGWYELKSSVVEDQSGFDRVMVVFHRPASILLQGRRVYNPLSANTYTEWGSTNFIESPEGLPLMKYTATTRPDTTSLTLAGIGSDPYARKGYYLRIGGEYYCITDRTGDTITWEGDVDQGIVDFELVYAIAVDLLNTEVSDTDGDGIIESVTRRGGTYDWSCSINSTNLPDGQMNIRYVAFDKAGNFAWHDDIVTRVENNPPKLAKVRLATDLDGNETITDGSGTPPSLDEWNPPYSLLTDGKESKEKTINASDFTAKDFMQVDIDLVGGNGTLSYSLPIVGHALTGFGTGGSIQIDSETSEEYQSAAATNVIEITLDQLRALGDGNKEFVFNIWDSTETYNVGDSDDFMAVLKVTLAVDVDDDVSPETVISPFFWNDVDDNSLYGNSRENGHIELATELPAGFAGTTGLMDRDSKVSGMITVRGTAFDDQRLTRLWMYLGNGSDDANAFVFTDAGGTKTAFDQNPADGTFTPVAVNGTYSLVAEFDPENGWEVADTTVEGEGWRFTVDSESDDAYFNQDGHMVAWILEIDTAQLPRHAETDFRFRMIAEDKRTNAGGTSTPNASAIGEKRVDIVPYIRTIGSVLSKLKKNNPSAYNRTALGRYPVSEDETITVSGFNLGGDQTVSMADHTSGDFTFTVNTIATLNNDNNNSVEYNQLPNGDNNPHLTDDVILDVWQLNSTAVHSVRGRIMEPVMKINPSNGMAGFAFANGVDSFSMANGSANSYTHWQRNYADYGEVAFGYDVNGETHGITIGYDTAPDQGYGGRMNYIYSQWGIPTLHQANNFRVSGKLRIESCGIPFGAMLNGNTVPGTGNANSIIDTTRFQSTSLAIAQRATPTVYLAYYDNLQEQIRFRWGTNTMATRGTGTGFDGFYDTDSAAGHITTNDDAYNEHIVFESPNTTYSLIAGDENDATNDTGNTAGEYVAIDVITGADATADIVTVVWYDGTDLWYTYRSGDKSIDANASSDGTAYWSKPIRIFEEAGLDCAISVDANDGVHIAAYDRVEGALRYAYLLSYDAAESEVETCIVDDYNIVGNKITITTVLDGKDNAIPYISYYAPSAQKPKLAYLVDPAGEKAPDGVNENTEFTGAWEITTIPTGSNVSEDRINVDLWRDGDNRATNSPSTPTVSDSTSGTVYGNGTSNPLAAYVVTVGTRGYIETAQKK